jgi:ribonucleotide reductase alpha subunit
MRDAAYEASIELAIERGPFPACRPSPIWRGGFASRLPEALKARIRQHGIRNSHLLSIAPTGTVSLAFADNASNGIEPPFSLAYTRNKREPDGGTRPSRWWTTACGCSSARWSRPWRRSARRGVPLPGRVHARASACA